MILGGQKLRIRKYEGNDQKFFEAKIVNVNDMQERKERIKIEALDDTKPLHPLSKTIETNYRRITFLKQGPPPVKITLDYDVSFYNHLTKKESGLGGALIVEVKSEGGDTNIDSMIINAGFNQCNLFSKSLGGAQSTTDTGEYPEPVNDIEENTRLQTDAIFQEFPKVV